VTVHQDKNLLTPRQSCEKLAAAVIERAVEDIKLMTDHGVLNRGAVNTCHRIFRRKKQFECDGWQDIRVANPRDVYSLLHFFDDEIKPFLKVAGINVAARTIKRAVIGGNVKMRSV